MKRIATAGTAAPRVATPATRAAPRDRYRSANYDTATVRRIAVEAEVDPRTVARFLDGERCLGLTATRIERALRTLSLEPAEVAK